MKALPFQETPLVEPEIARMGNPPWEEAEFRCLVVRLSPFRDVEQSTSHLVVFDEVRKANPRAFVDFAFLPKAGARKSLAKEGNNWFSGRISGQSPSQFDLILVSNAFALELFNLPYLFGSPGLPPLASQREKDETMPFVVLGGSNASAAGAAVLESIEAGMPARDSIPDGMFFGEGEGSIGRLASILCGARRIEGSKAEILARAGREIPGFWPCRQSPGTRRVVAEDRPHTLLSPLVLNGENACTVRLAISAGCMGYCSFCLEGWDRSPYGEAEFSRLVAAAKELKRNSGASDLDILSFNFNTHARVFDLMLELGRIFRRVSFMSQRLDILARTEGLMEAELAAGKKSFTLGIEGISKAMRAYYRKGLDEKDLDRCLELCLGKGVRELKLFFIISGREGPEDFGEFDSLLQGIKARKERNGSGTKVLVSAGYLVRLPFTPLQFEGLSFHRGRLEDAAAVMQRSCEAWGAEFRLAGEPQECFADQALSLFGGTILPFLLKIPSLGHVYDGTLPRRAWESLESFLSALPELPALMQPKPEGYKPPLAFLEDPVRHAVLWSHFKAAQDFEDRSGCFGSRCSACGVCVDPGEIVAMTGHRIEAPRLARDEYLKTLRTLSLEKGRFPALTIQARLPKGLAFADPSYRASWLAREIFAQESGSSALVFEVRESLFVSGSSFASLFPPGAGRYGASRFSIYGPSKERIAALIGRLAPKLSELGMSLEEDRTPVEIALRLRPGLERSMAGTKVGKWLEASRVPFTARKVPGGWNFEIPDAARGRRKVYGARIMEDAECCAVEIRGGEKMDLPALFESLGAGDAEVLGFLP